MLGVAMALARGVPIIVLTPEENLGVAASWNAMLTWAGIVAITISNDDVELGEDALEILDSELTRHDFVHAGGWCLFAQTRACTDRVGFYDENFYPAYYEDSDYEWRLLLAGIPVHHAQVTLKHEGWATTQVDSSLNDAPQKSAEYFLRKWGGMPDDPAARFFRKPFGGSAESEPLNLKQTNWVNYKPAPTMRWDVINHIAKVLQARTYLEIGVSSGESIRHVDIEKKFGVDPEPQPDGVRCCDVFYPKTSNEFFENNENTFDVVFIDGYHSADQAYLDIFHAVNASRIVVVHDANPSSEEMQLVPGVGGNWTGDVWKAIARVRSEGLHTTRTIDTDFGVAIVIPNRRDETGELGLPFDTWEDLQTHRMVLLGLIPVSEWKSWFAGVIR